MITTEYVVKFLRQDGEIRKDEKVEYIGTISLAELIEKLRPAGRYIASQRDHRNDIHFYLLSGLNDNAPSSNIEAFTLDDEALQAVDRCGNCADFSKQTADGLAYGPFCSTYSDADNIERNERLISE